MPATQSTLLQFHGSHFRGQPLPSLTHPTLGFASTDGLQEIKNTERTNDVLGHYADGFKRTLTDEQIAIFRHTEIQELLRERSQRADTLAGSAVALDHIAAARSSQAPSPERENLSLPSILADEDRKYGIKEEEQLCDNAETHDECLTSASKVHNPAVGHVDQDLNQALSVEHWTNVKINPPARKTIRYQEDDLSPNPNPTAASLCSKAPVKSRFVWPELRHQG
ncbi:hypothetical protein EPUS_00936 [Endocarpon pusillum Z07020]|uniref:Uncharacterized protein n=1 Tax=Endocarpon pusillum (strain Z07020 / HMAS-L-300199) TaxID=1263415 RepID=U1GN41_ENDPU|nr:uncharacterized protein EPUS_00936 [Endocarpon pusillum Z07020]ERF73683.1 hypothetical protein EPUS_00936 [Endocarpon pusillum Z07020]